MLKLVYDVVEILVKVFVAKIAPLPTILNDTVIVVAVPPCILNNNEHACPGYVFGNIEYVNEADVEGNVRF